MATDNRIMTWKGRPLKELSKEELIHALNFVANYYECRIAYLKEAKEYEKPSD